MIITEHFHLVWVRLFNWNQRGKKINADISKVGLVFAYRNVKDGCTYTHPPPHRHIDSHQASVLTEIFFSNYREQSLGPPSASSSSSSSPHFPCGANEDADSTPYWHAAKSPSLPPTVSFFPLLISTRLPSGSFHPFMVPPRIQRWHEWNAQLLIAGTQMHRTRGEPRMAEGEEAEGEKIQHQKVEDRRLLCAATAWLNWVTRTGSDRQMLNIIYQTLSGSLEQGYTSATEALVGGKMMWEGWL